MSEIADNEGLEHTVTMRERLARRHIDDNTYSFRMYLHFMGKGDLGDMIHHYERTQQRIPEPMIWYTAEALALCGIAMHHGTIPDDQNIINVVPGWREIVHRDLKPGNVFLERSDEAAYPPDIYPTYDRPVLGDYGMSIKTHTGDPFNPRLYNNRSVSLA